MEAVLPIAEGPDTDGHGWRVLDIRLQYFPDTNILTDSVAVSLLLPYLPSDNLSDQDYDAHVARLMETYVPREIMIGGKHCAQVTWVSAPPYCSLCKSIGHSQRFCPADADSIASDHIHGSSVGIESRSSSVSANSQRRKRGRRGGKHRHNRYADKPLPSQPTSDDPALPNPAMSSTSAHTPPVSEVASSIQLPSSMNTLNHENTNFSVASLSSSTYIVEPLMSSTKLSNINTADAQSNAHRYPPVEVALQDVIDEPEEDQRRDRVFSASSLAEVATVPYTTTSSTPYNLGNGNDNIHDVVNSRKPIISSVYYATVVDPTAANQDSSSTPSNGDAQSGLDAWTAGLDQNVERSLSAHSGVVEMEPFEFA